MAVSPGAAQSKNALYAFSGKYDRAIFNPMVQKSVVTGDYTADSLGNVGKLLAQVEQDPAMTDVRWTAYLLATAMWETRVRMQVPRPVKPAVAKHHKPARPKSPFMTLFQVATPAHEQPGKPLRYWEPVKLQPRPDGTILMIEHDGDQFVVTPDAAWRPVITYAWKHGKKIGHRPEMGAPFDGDEASIFTHSTGTEHVYYGRGFVQLTWWSNYLKAGQVLNLGTNLLTDPELACDPDIAYKIATIGMREGKIFTPSRGKRKFSDFFNDQVTDYTGARVMVNPKDPTPVIPRYALSFEDALMKSRILPKAPGAVR